MPKIPQILVFSLNMHFSRIRSKLLALLQPGVNTLCVRANAVAGVVQPSCHSCHIVSLTANSLIVPVSEENTVPTLKSLRLSAS